MKINTDRVVLAGWNRVQNMSCDDRVSLWHETRNSFVRALRRELGVPRLNKKQFDATCDMASAVNDTPGWDSSWDLAESILKDLLKNKG